MASPVARVTARTTRKRCAAPRTRGEVLRPQRLRDGGGPDAPSRRPSRASCRASPLHARPPQYIQTGAPPHPMVLSSALSHSHATQTTCPKRAAGGGRTHAPDESARARANAPPPARVPWLPHLLTAIECSTITTIITHARPPRSDHCDGGGPLRRRPSPPPPTQPVGGGGRTQRKASAHISTHKASRELFMLPPHGVAHSHRAPRPRSPPSPDPRPRARRVPVRGGTHCAPPHTRRPAHRLTAATRCAQLALTGRRPLL